MIRYQNIYLTVLALALLACRQVSEEKKHVNVKQQVIVNETKTPILTTIGETIQGDFDGDGQIDTATVTKVKEGKGNPVEDGTADEYEIRFSGTQLKAITAGCCEIRLINEGDLDKDGKDEISLFQAPMNGCTHSMATYSFKNRAWEQIVETFLIPTGCNNSSDADLQNRVFKENDVIYYLYTDPNDDSGNLIKKKVMSK